MALIKFIKSYRGKETKELHYQPGDVFELENEPAEFLVDGGFAVMVESEAAEVDEPTIKKITKRGGKKVTHG